MKKFLWIVLACVALIGGCGTSSDSSTQAAKKSTQIITVYEADDQAEYVVPREVTYTEGTDNEKKFVQFLFDEVVVEDVKLNSYKFSSDRKILTLDLNDGVMNVQGSAGGQMFMGTLAETYFVNFPKLKEIVLLHNGSDEMILDHVFIGEPIMREPSFKKPK